MSITIAQRAARLAEMPMFCASCGSQDPGARYVDFDAAWDGPVVNPEDGIKMQIDDLVVCENCLKEASALVGLVDPDQTAETLARAQQDLIAKEEKIAELQRYIDGLQTAISAKPGGRQPAQPKAKERKKVVPLPGSRAGKTPPAIEAVPDSAAESSEGVKIIRVENES